MAALEFRSAPWGRTGRPYGGLRHVFIHRRRCSRPQGGGFVMRAELLTDLLVRVFFGALAVIAAGMGSC